jgi:Fe-S-cluster formation regulator IscX/YfhJ
MMKYYVTMLLLGWVFNDVWKHIQRNERAKRIARELEDRMPRVKPNSARFHSKNARGQRTQSDFKDDFINN